jgi:hypothetical protein
MVSAYVSQGYCAIQESIDPKSNSSWVANHFYSTRSNSLRLVRRMLLGVYDEKLRSSVQQTELDALSH